MASDGWDHRSATSSPIPLYYHVTEREVSSPVRMLHGDLALQRKVVPTGADIRCGKRYECRPQPRAAAPTPRYVLETILRLVTSSECRTYARIRKQLCAVVLVASAFPAARQAPTQCLHARTPECGLWARNAHAVRGNAADRTVPPRTFNRRAGADATWVDVRSEILLDSEHDRLPNAGPIFPARRWRGLGRADAGRAGLLLRMELRTRSIGVRERATSCQHVARFTYAQTGSAV